jgi:transposase
MGRVSRLPDRFLAAIAKDYVEALKRGDLPSMAVAEIHRVHRATARTWIHNARKRGFLLGNTGLGGRSGGQLSASAVHILNEKRQ